MYFVCMECVCVRLLDSLGLFLPIPGIASHTRRARVSVNASCVVSDRRARVPRETVTSTSTRVGERGERRGVNATARVRARATVAQSMDRSTATTGMTTMMRRLSRDDDRARWDARCVRSRCVRTVDDDDAGVVGGGVERVERRGRGAIRRGGISRGWTGVQGGAGKGSSRGVCRRRRWRWR